MTAMWCEIAAYPLDRRPASVAANLALDTLKAVRRERRPVADLVTPPHLVRGRGGPGTGAGGRVGPAGPRVRASRTCSPALVGTGSSTRRRATCCTACTPTASPGESAARRHGLSPGAVRQRCSRALRVLARHADLLVRGMRTGSADAARAELDAHAGSDRPARLGDGVLPRALARAAHDDEVAVVQRVPDRARPAHRARGAARAWCSVGGGRVGRAGRRRRSRGPRRRRRGDAGGTRAASRARGSRRRCRSSGRARSCRRARRPSRRRRGRGRGRHSPAVRRARARSAR